MSASTKYIRVMKHSASLLGVALFFSACTPNVTQPACPKCAAMQRALVAQMEVAESRKARPAKYVTELKRRQVRIEELEHQLQECRDLSEEIGPE